MKKLLTCLSMAIILLVAVGCSGTTSSTPEKVDFFTTPNAVATAMQELHNQEGLKGKEILIFQDVLVYKNEIRVDIVKPGTDDVDEYTYEDGKWKKPQPVKLSGSGSVQENSNPISAFDFTKVPDMVKVVNEKAKEANIENYKPVDLVTYGYNPSSDLRIVNIIAAGDRVSYCARFTFKGELIEFRKL